MIPALALAVSAAWSAFWGPAFGDLHGQTGPILLEIAGTPAAHHALVPMAYHLPPGGTVYLLIGVTADNVPVQGGLLVPHPTLMLAAKANAEGVAMWVLPLSVKPPTFFAQCLSKTGKVTNLSNAVAVIPGAIP